MLQLSPSVYQGFHNTDKESGCERERTLNDGIVANEIQRMKGEYLHPRPFFEYSPHPRHWNNAKVSLSSPITLNGN